MLFHTNMHKDAHISDTLPVTKNTDGGGDIAATMS